MRNRELEGGEKAVAVGFLGCAFVLILAKLALIIGVIYVVIHFISKYW